MTITEQDAAAMAVKISEAVNNYDKLKENKEYVEAEGKRLSEVATHWQKECERIKSDNAILLETLKQIYNFIGVADNTRDTAMRAWAIKYPSEPPYLFRREEHKH